MANKITIDGVDYEIDLDNLASEATLRAFAESTLKTDEEAAKFLENLTRLQARATQAIEEQADNEESAFDRMLRTTNQAGNESAGILGGFGKVMGGITKSIPVLGSVLGGLIGAVTGVVQGMWQQARMVADIITEFNKTGVLFTGSMTELIFLSGQAGMKLSELSGLASKNMMLISRIGGGDIRKGLNSFTQAVTGAFEGVEGVTPGLAALGYTAAETGELMATYLDIQDRVNERSILSGLNESQRQQRLTNGVAKFAKDLFELSRLTGKSRDELLGTFNDIAKDSEFLLATSGVQNAEAVHNVATFLKSISEELYESFVSVLRYDSLTGAVENNVMMMQLLGSDISNEFTRITRELEQNTISEDDAKQQLQQLFGSPEVQATLRNSLATLGTEFTKDPGVQAIIKMTAEMRKATEDQQKAYEEWVEDNKNILEDTSKEAYNRYLEEQQLANQQIGRSVRLFDAMLNRISNAFAGIFIKIVDNKSFNNFLQEFIIFVNRFFDAITMQIGPILDSNMGIWDKITAIFSVVFTELKERLWPLLKPYFESAWSKLAAGISYTFQMMIAELQEMVGFIETAKKTRFEAERTLAIGQGYDPLQALEKAELEEEKRRIQAELDAQYKELATGKTVRFLPYESGGAAGIVGESPITVSFDEKQVRTRIKELENKINDVDARLKVLPRVATVTETPKLRTGEQIMQELYGNLYQRLSANPDFQTIMFDKRIEETEIPILRRIVEDTVNQSVTTMDNLSASQLDNLNQLKSLTIVSNETTKILSEIKDLLENRTTIIPNYLSDEYR